MKTFTDMIATPGMNRHEILHYASLSDDPAVRELSTIVDENTLELFAAQEESDANLKQAEKMEEERDEAVVEMRALNSKLADAALQIRAVDKLLTKTREALDNAAYTVSPTN